METIEKHSLAATSCVNLNFDVKDTIFPEAVYMREVGNVVPAISRGFRWETSATTGAEAFLEFEPLAAQMDIFGKGTAVAWWEGALLFMAISGNYLFLRGAGNPETVDRVVRRLREIFPEVVTDRDEVKMRFWMDDPPHGPMVRSKDIQSPTWDESSMNYPARTRHHLAHLMTEYRPSDTGLLFLWHGEPGTGKTWAIQTLAREWKDWCRVDCITDPEAFLSSARYMHHVLLDEELHAKEWRLIVLEDTGELLSSDAKMRTGQALSRLLNLTDGLMGRGSKSLVLITSNEDLETFHPAVSRAGRCASNLRFDPLDIHEARTWLASKGHPDHLVTSKTPLADLYALGRGHQPASEQPVAVGFRPSS